MYCISAEHRASAPVPSTAPAASPGSSEKRRLDWTPGGVVAQRAKKGHLDTVTTQPTSAPGGSPQEPAGPPPPAPPEGSPEWYALPFEVREIRKARERAARASRRADRAARRLREAQERASGQRTGTRQFLDVAGDAATAALTCGVRRGRRGAGEARGESSDA